MGLLSYFNTRNIKALGDRRHRPKALNFLVNKIDSKLGNETAHSFPYIASMNITNICNLRCRFCEIHYFYKKAKDIAGKVFPNHLNVETLKRHKRWLKRIITIELSGANGEPFASPDIAGVITYLKELGIRLTATTNGQLIDEAMARHLIESRFDSLLFSVHAGDRETYAKLQGGDFDAFLSRLESLISLRRQLNSQYPKTSMNFALNRENAAGIKALMKRARDIGIDSFMVNHYYDCRNALKKDISFYFNVAECNTLLKDAYAYADELGLKMEPPSPPYLTGMTEPDTEERVAGRCEAPWTTIKFKGCVEYDSCEYICVCNRIILFRIDYNRFYANGKADFLRHIWNSGVLKYLRKTVNSPQGNPICRFCRDADTPRIRCLDNVEYSRRRDRAIVDFFRDFRNSGYPQEDVDGLTLLNENPYKYDERDGF